MLLARTMTVAFVPGILVAAVVPLSCRPALGPAAGLLNLGLLCVAAFAVAAPWYLHNLDSVVDYLTEFGYGRKSAEYGDLPLDRLLGLVDASSPGSPPRTCSSCLPRLSSSAWRPSWSRPCAVSPRPSDRPRDFATCSRPTHHRGLRSSAVRLCRAVTLPQRGARVHPPGDRPSGAAGGACAAQAPAGCRTRLVALRA